VKEVPTQQQLGLGMMDDQSSSFSRPGQLRTKREVFLERMNELLPWRELEAVIEPHYP
jgi:transposase, IS5 family